MNRIVVLISFGDKSALNSRWIPSINLFHSKDHRDGTIQYSKGMNNIPRKVDSQLAETVNKEEEGSKTENKFVIIFNSVSGA